MQQTALFVSLFLMAVLAVAFAFVFARSRQSAEYEPIQKQAYRLRRYVFGAAVAIIVIAATLTLRQLPYGHPASAAGEPLVIQVNSSQFLWEMSTKQAQAGQLVRFDVTSRDVNHGFGIYDENMRALAQTQAMPGYTNKLYYTFTKPGKYKILCLEYCGAAHHFMADEFEVLPGSK